MNSRQRMTRDIYKALLEAFQEKQKAGSIEPFDPENIDIWIDIEWFDGLLHQYRTGRIYVELFDD